MVIKSELAPTATSGPIRVLGRQPLQRLADGREAFGIGRKLARGLAGAYLADWSGISAEGQGATQYGVFS